MVTSSKAFLRSAASQLKFWVSIRSRIRKTSAEAQKTLPFELRPNSDEFGYDGRSRNFSSTIRLGMREFFVGRKRSSELFLNQEPLDSIVSIRTIALYQKVSVDRLMLYILQLYSSPHPLQPSTEIRYELR